jgi:uncharacterized phage-like protein YoqJ
MINQVDYNAALATIDYLRETVEQYKEQLKKRDTYTCVKVEGNFWVYGSEQACNALQKILLEHSRLVQSDVNERNPDKGAG